MADANAGAAAAPEEASEAQRYRDDPRYAKYFRMLDLKIPLVAVQQKMVVDGLDPAILKYGMCVCSCV